MMDPYKPFYILDPIKSLLAESSVQHASYFTSQDLLMFLFYPHSNEEIRVIKCKRGIMEKDGRFILIENFEGRIKYEKIINLYGDHGIHFYRYGLFVL